MNLTVGCRKKTKQKEPPSCCRGFEVRYLRVLDGLAPESFRDRERRRIVERAEIGHRAMKDLRDPFASQLLTAGVPL
jgi:hypothetical protein